jgi:hypothetical protein
MEYDLSLIVVFIGFLIGRVVSLQCLTGTELVVGAMKRICEIIVLKTFSLLHPPCVLLQITFEWS